MRSCVGGLLSAVFLAAFPAMAQAIALGQIDTFEGGNTANWTNGAFGGVGEDVLTGGPAGAADHFLSVTADGDVNPPRLVTFNRTQWTGNFSAAGVTSIEMDLKNFGGDPLPIRIAIREGTGGGGTAGYSSTTPFTLVADGLWHHASFSLSAMTGINSPQPLATDLGAVAEFRLLSSALPSLQGDGVVAQIGADNIAAVPEPATVVLAFVGMGLLAALRRGVAVGLLGIVLAAAFPTLAHAVSQGQTDTFEGGTTAGWTDGHGGIDETVLTGGPAGASDHFLSISSDGVGAEGRLITFNRTQWIGNYVTAGVTSIEMDLKNFTASPLPIRIAIRQGTGGSLTPGYVSTTPFTLATDGLWHHAVFSLSAMTGINSPQPLATDLASVAEFRLLSSSSPSLQGDVMTAQIGADNIAAVPEPATIVLALVGMGLLAALRPGVAA